MRILRSALTALLVCLIPSAVPAQQQAQGPPAGSVQVAVFPLTGLMIGNAAQQAQLAEVFRSMIITEMAGANVQLVERQTIDRLLEAQNIALTGAVSDAQAIQVGQMLGAQYAVAGSISVVGSEARLDLRMLDIETSEAVHRWKDSTHPDRLLSLVDGVARDFAGRAQLKPRELPVVIPVHVSLAFSQGLDFERRGRRQDAARMYRQVLDLFPQHPHARAALQRVN